MILKQNLKKCLTYFLKDCRRKFWRFRINSNWKSVPLRPINFFGKLHKSPLLVPNIVKGTVSSLRQFLATESAGKIMKNTFYFILTNWISFWQIWFCSNHAFSLNQVSDIRKVWKYWALKMVSSQFLKNLKGFHFAVSGLKTFKILADISFESSL